MTAQPGDDTESAEGDEPTVFETWTSPLGVERDKRMAEL